MQGLSNLFGYRKLVITQHLMGLMTCGTHCETFWYKSVVECCRKLGASLGLRIHRKLISRVPNILLLSQLLKQMNHPLGTASDFAT